MDPLLDKNLISTKEASEISGYNSDYLARLCKANKINGRQFGRTWLVDRSSLEEFIKTQGQRKIDRARALARAREDEYRSAQPAEEKVKRALDSSVAIRVVPETVERLTTLSATRSVLWLPRVTAVLAAFAAVLVVGTSAYAAQSEFIPNVAHTAATFVGTVRDGFAQIAEAQLASVGGKIAAAHTASDLAQSHTARLARGTALPQITLALAQPNLAAEGAALHGRVLAEKFEIPQLPSHIADATQRARAASRLVVIPSFAQVVAVVTNAPQEIAQMNLALGNAVIALAQGAIALDVRLAYATAPTADGIARGTTLAIGAAAEKAVALGNTSVQALALATGAGMQHIATVALGGAAFEWSALQQGGQLAYETYSGMSTAMHIVAPPIGNTLSRGAASLARGIAAPRATVEDWALAALGKGALALNQFTPSALRTPLSNLAAAVAPLAAASSERPLSVSERTALGTYQAIHGLFSATTDSLATLFMPRAIVVAPNYAVSNHAPVVSGATKVAVTPIATTTLYRTYTTNITGVSQSYVDSAIALARSGMYAEMSSLIAPLSHQVATNVTSIQQVNMIQSLSNLILHNPVIDGAQISSGAATLGSLAVTGQTNLSSLASGTTTLSGELTLATLASGGTQCLQIDAAGRVTGTGLACGSGTGSSAGATLWATTTDSLALYPVTPTQSLIVGASATTTQGNIFETHGNAYVSGALTLGSPLAITSGGLGTSTLPTANKVLLSDAAGNWEYVATSSLGITAGIWGQVTGSLADQGDLSAALASKLDAVNYGSNFYNYFHATTTDALTEGSTNKYWSQTLFDTAFAGKTTTGLAEGTNQYFTNARAITALTGQNISLFVNDAGYALASSLGSSFYNYFHATTTTALAEGTNQYFTNARAITALTGQNISLFTNDAGYALAANFGSSFYNFFHATTTDALTEGSTNKYWSQTLFDTAFAGKTTTGLAEGTNQYFTNARADARAVSVLSATTTLPNLTTLTGITTLPNLTLAASRISGTLALNHGGTGITSYSTGDVLYADSSGVLQKLPAGATGQVLKIQAGLPAWGLDQTVGGGGSDGIFATSTGLIYPLDTSMALLVGSDMQSGVNNIFEVNGNSYFNGRLGVGSSSPEDLLTIRGNGVNNLFDAYDAAGASAFVVGPTGTVTVGSLDGVVIANHGTLDAIATTSIAFSGPFTSSGTLGSLVGGSNFTLTLPQSSGTIDGYLASADWATFNNKVGATRTIATTYPLLGGGDLSADRTLSLDFGTSTSNIWGGVQTFTSAPVLGALSGLVGANSGTLYSVASSSLFGYLPISNVLAPGNFLVGNDSGVAQATSTIFMSSSGNLGISTTSPLSRLTVAGDLNLDVLATSSASQQLGTLAWNGTSFFGKLGAATAGVANGGWFDLAQDNTIDVFIIAGQSNAIGRGDYTKAPTVTPGTAYQYENGAIHMVTNQVGENVSYTTGSTGNSWPAFADAYYRATGHKVLFVMTAAGGSGLEPELIGTYPTWDPSDPATDYGGTNLYHNSINLGTAALSAARAAGFSPVFKGVLWHQGETDGGAINLGTIAGLSGDNYKTSLNALIASYRTSFGSTAPFYIFEVGMNPTSGDPFGGAATIRAAQTAMDGADPYTKVVFANAIDYTTRGLMKGDTSSHYSQEGYNEMGRIGASAIVSAKSGFALQRVSTTTPDLYFTSGNIGIGTTNPTARMQVDAVGTTTLSYFLSSSGSGTNSSAYVANSIASTTLTSSSGTAYGSFDYLVFNPTAVSSSATIRNRYMLTTIAPGNTAAITGNIGGLLSFVTNQSANITGSLTGILGAAYNNVGGSEVVNAFGLQAAAGTNVGSAYATTTNAIAVLATQLNVSSHGLIRNRYGVYASSTNSGLITNDYGFYASGVGVGGTITNKFDFYGADADAYNYFAGNVGIGTTSPYAVLSVSTTTANYAGQTLLSVAGATNSTLFNVLGNGNVGIGTTSPFTNLSVQGNGFFSGSLTASSLVTDRNTVNLNNQYFLFEGDSITFGSLNATPATQNPGYYFSQMSFASGHGTYSNDAVSGSTIGAGTNGGNNITDRYTANVYPHRPRANGGDGGPRAYIFLMIGTNDISTLGLTASQVITALNAYITQARSDGFTVVLSTILPRTYNSSWTAAKEATRLAVNLAISKGAGVAAGTSAIVASDYVVDGASALPNPSDATDYYSDGVHPTATGDQVLASRINSVMLAGGSQYVLTNQNFSGPVGIGTTSPFTTLSVSGNAYVSGSLNTGDPNATRYNLGLANPLLGGIYSVSSITAWGDSLTSGGQGGSGVHYPSEIATDFNRTVSNQGVGGQTSTQIGVREGGISTTATVSGGQIPASGGVTVTFPGGYEPVTSQGPAGGVSGTISGVYGTVTLSGSTYTFTRTTAGSIVNVSSAPFVVDTGVLNNGTVIIWAGRNNYTNPAQVESDIDAMVAHLGANTHYLIISVLNGDYANEYIGQSGYNQIIGINNYLLGKYPGHYLDVREYLVQHALADAAITPTAQDLIDISRDVPPSSLRFDTLHLTGTGYRLIAKQVENIMAITPNSVADIFASPLPIGSTAASTGSFTNVGVGAGYSYLYNGTKIANASTTLNNYFFGNAGNLTMTGTYNTGIGNNALLSNTTGGFNLAAGAGALVGNTTGTKNLGVGVNTLFNNLSGSQNTAIGFQAGYNPSVSLQTVSNSTFIGTGANSSVDGIINAMALGYNAQVTASNQVVIGNSSVTQTLLNGNVGIGTTTPLAPLEVDSIVTNASTKGASFFESSVATTNGTYSPIGLNAVLNAQISSGVTNSGNLIGFNSGTLRNYLLTGDAGTLANLVGEGLVYGHFNTDTSVSPTTTTAKGLSITPYIKNGTITNMYDLYLGGVQTGGTVTNHWGMYQTDAASNNYFAGNVGIGSTTPFIKLAVAGSGAFASTLFTPFLSQYSRYDAYGDSITSGSLASDAAHQYVNIIASTLNVPFANHGIGGWQAADVFDSIYPTAAPSSSGSQLFTHLIGTNDVFYYGADADKEANFKLFDATALAYLAIPNTNKLLGQSASITYSGSWSNSGLYGGGISKFSTTNGNTATFTLHGSAIYLAYTMKDGNGGLFSVSVDGTPMANATSSGMNGALIATKNLTNTGGSALLRIGNLSDTNHTVVVTVTSATGVGNVVWLDWVASAGGNVYATGPTVIAGGIPHSTHASITDPVVNTYNALIRQNVAQLASDGLNVTYADDTSYVLTASDLGDTIHPNDTGHQHIADAFLAAINAGSTAQVKGGALTANALGSLLSVSGSSLGLGTVNPLAFDQAPTVVPRFQVSGTSAAAAMSAIRYSYDTGASRLVLAHSRGTADGLFAPLQNADAIGRIAFDGSTNTTDASSTAAFIQATVDGTPDATHLPGALVFGTTPSTGSFTNAIERMRITSTGNVGIGSTSPYATLSVQHAYGSANTTLFSIASSTSSGGTTANTYLSVLANGNVGIGTTSPANIVDVLKDQNAVTTAQITNRDAGATAQAQFSVNNGTGSALLAVTGTGFTTTGVYQANYGILRSSAGLSGLKISSGSATGSLILSTVDVERMRIDSTGNVGIGTTTPNRALTVSSAGGATTNSLMNIEQTNASAGNAWMNFSIRNAHSYALGVTQAGLFQVGYSAAGPAGLGTNPRLTIDTSGNIGIGTTSPFARLSNTGADTSASTENLILANSNNLPLFSVNNAGQAILGSSLTPVPTVSGITAFTPAFQINSTASNASMLMSRFSNDVNPGRIAFLKSAGTTVGAVNALTNAGGLARAVLGELSFAGTNGTQAAEGAKLKVYTTADNTGLTYTPSAFGFFTSDGSTDPNASERLTIYSNGNVGIGTTTPSALLHLVSNSMSAAADIFKITDASAGSANVFGIRANIAGTDYAQFTVRDSAVMTLDQNGFVGIGTTTPKGKLAVGMSADADNAFTVSNAIGSTTLSASTLDTNGAIFSVATSTGTDYFDVMANGTVGIGSTTPGALLALHALAGTTYPGNNLFTIGSTTAAGVKSTLLTVTNAGNVGIGTAAPTARLQVQASGVASTRESIIKANVSDAGNDAFFVANGTAGDGRFAPQFGGYVDSHNTTFSLGLGGYTNAANDASDSSNYGLVRFFTLRTDSVTDPLNGTLSLIQNRKLFTWDNGGTTLMTIAASGNIGIGTTTPWANLSVVNSAGGPGFVVGGGAGGISPQLAVDSAGKVGVGTANPYTNLQIKGADGALASAASGIFAVGTGEGYNSAHLMFGVDTSTPVAYGWIGAVKDSSTWANLVLAPISNTKVGIATTTPNTALTVHASGVNGINLDVNGSDPTSSGRLFFMAASGTYASYASANGLNFSYGATITSSSGTTGLLLSPTGNVGIGTTTPAYALDVNGSAQLEGSTAALAINPYGGISDSNYIRFTGGRGTIGYANGGEMILQSGVSKDLRFITNSATLDDTSHTVMVIGGGNTATAGNVGIGTTTPASRLHVAGTNDATGGLTIESTAGTGKQRLAIYSTGNLSTNIQKLQSSSNLAFLNSAGNPEMTLDSNGNIISANKVGIGTTSAATLLEVGGSTANVTFDGYKSCTGFTSNANGLVACTASDQRLKQDITPLTGTEVLAAIGALNPVSFYWKPGTDRGSKQQYGFIAQQVQSVFPNLVQTSSPTELTPDGTLSVNYEGLIAPAIVAIQQLDARTSFIGNTTRAATSTLTLDAATGNVGIGAASATAKLAISGNVFATEYDVKQSPVTSFSFGSTTMSGSLPSTVLTASGAVDMYKLATYNLSGLAALAARIESSEVHMASLESRIAALESGAVGTATSTSAFSTSTLASALSGLGAYLEQGVAQFGSLVADQFVAATNSAGTSSAGTVVIPAGNMVAIVTNAYVAPSSKIFVTFTASTTASWYISDKQQGSFKLTLSEAQSSDLSFDYFIVQTEGQIATSSPAVSSTAVQQSGHAGAGPTITMMGENPLHVDVDAGYSDPGVSVVDAAGGSIPLQYFIDGAQVGDLSRLDTSKASTHVVTYSATNVAGVTATAERTVIVGAGSHQSGGTPPQSTDTTKPVVTLNGSAALTATQGVAWTDPGASAEDDTDGDLTAKISETGTVDTATLGTYTLTYTAIDAAGNSGSASRVVTVIAAPPAVEVGAASSTPDAQ